MTFPSIDKPSQSSRRPIFPGNPRESFKSSVGVAENKYDGNVEPLACAVVPLPQRPGEGRDVGDRLEAGGAPSLGRASGLAVNGSGRSPIAQEEEPAP
jgi:hypothetical protein